MGPAMLNVGQLVDGCLVEMVAPSQAGEIDRRGPSLGLRDFKIYVRSPEVTVGNQGSEYAQMIKCMHKRIEIHVHLSVLRSDHFNYQLTWFICWQK